MIKQITLSISACLLLMSAHSHAMDSLATPNWSRAEAVSAAGRIDHDGALDPLYRLAVQKNDRELLDRLQTIATRNDWTAPARESVLHRFAAGLGDLPSWPGGFEVLAYLEDYSPRTLVPHDDHARAGVPLFNIRAVAAGSAARWRQDLAWSRAGRLLQAGPETWIDAYLEADMGERLVYVHTLQSASASQLQHLGDLAIAGIGNEPSLTLVAARSGLLLSDTELFSQAMVKGQGPGVAEGLRQAAVSFDEIQAERILRDAMEKAPPANASLAMAYLAPALIRYTDIEELMFQALEHKELGSSAALLLSASKDASIRQRLDAVAADSGSLAGKRAALAVSAGLEARGGAQ